MCVKVQAPAGSARQEIKNVAYALLKVQIMMAGKLSQARLAANTTISLALSSYCLHQFMTC